MMGAQLSPACSRSAGKDRGTNHLEPNQDWPPPPGTEHPRNTRFSKNAIKSQTRIGKINQAGPPAGYAGRSPWRVSQYSRLSERASQEASMTSVEEPTVVQVSSPSVDSMSTRVVAAVPAAESMMRTL